MKYSSKEHFPQLLCCSICFYPPYKPRISGCQCDMLFCFKCIRNQKDSDRCILCKWRLQQYLLPKIYKYILENILVKCSNCQEYQPALKYKKHEIQCQKKNELIFNQQSIYHQNQVPLLTNNQQYQKILRQTLILSELAINELYKTPYNCSMCFKQFDGIINSSHFLMCQEQRVSCEIEYCEWTGARINYNEHLQSCIQNQIKKNDQELNKLELTNFILSRNQFLNSSEAQIVDQRIIILRHMTEETELLIETPLRNSFQPSIQSFLYSDQ